MKYIILILTGIAIFSAWSYLDDFTPRLQPSPEECMADTILIDRIGNPSITPDTIILPSGRVAVRPGHGNVQLYDISEADGTIHQFYKGKEVGRPRRRVTR